MDDFRVVNAEGLFRFKNEFVRHKILDTIGDFALFLGMRLLEKLQLSNQVIIFTTCYVVRF